MVDRGNRDVGAIVLRDLIDGEITNDEFMAKFPRNGDPALRAILEFAWQLFSDSRVHRLKGRNAPRPEHGAILERCYLFLKTDLEFEWPVPKHRIARGLLQILSFGRLSGRFEREYKSKGDFDVWPFLRRSDYEAVGTRIRP